MSGKKKFLFFGSLTDLLCYRNISFGSISELKDYHEINCFVVDEDFVANLKLENLKGSGLVPIELVVTADLFDGSLEQVYISNSFSHKFRIEDLT